MHKCYQNQLDHEKHHAFHLAYVAITNKGKVEKALLESFALNNQKQNHVFCIKKVNTVKIDFH